MSLKSNSGADLLRGENYFWTTQNEYCIKPFFMKHIALLFLLCFSLTLKSQQPIYYSDFLTLDVFNCPFDSTVQIIRPADWEFYQTTNGLWDGPHDSTRCISIDYDGFSNKIDVPLSQLDLSEPLFVLSHDLGTSIPMLPNSSYVAALCAEQSGPDSLKYVQGTACSEGLCSGMFVQIAIPDSFSNDYAATRFQTGLAKHIFFAPCEGVNTCFPTEKFAHQALRRLLLKYTFPNKPGVANEHLYLSQVSIEAVPFSGLITSVNAEPDFLTNGVYEVPVEAVSSSPFANVNILQYTADTYPDAQHLSYVEAQPTPNTSTPQTINLNVNIFQTLEVQPFTELRGGLVSGSDSVRHQVNVVNLGGDFCLNSFVDLIFNGGNEYQHGGGHLVMQNARTCMQFRKGSDIRVLEGASLYYGNSGAGMLVLCEDSKLILERNARMIFDGLLSLSECNGNTAPQEVFVDLLPGSELSFTDQAVLTNQYSQFGNVTLGVRMLGGILDDGALPAAQRSLIRRIYPLPAATFEDNIRFFPNPFAETAQVRYIAGQDEKLRLNWFDASGRLVKTENVAAVKGYNEWAPDLPACAGVYLLEITGQGGRARIKVVAN